MPAVFWVSLIFFIIIQIGFGLRSLPGQLVAFGDLNYDRLTDVLVYNKTKNQLKAFLATTEESDDFHESLVYEILLSSNVSEVYGAYVSDYDGDSLPDVAVFVKDLSKSHDKFTVQVFWNLAGSRPYSQKSYFSPHNFSEITFDQLPLTLDCNLDHVADFFGEVNGKRKCAIGSQDRNFELIDDHFAGTSKILDSAFVDLNQDLQPEVFLRTANSNEKNGIQFEVWEWSGETWVQLQNFMPPPTSVFTGKKPLLATGRSSADSSSFGPSVWTDFNSDGAIDHLIAINRDSSVTGDWAILRWSHKTKEWEEIQVIFEESQVGGAGPWEFSFEKPIYSGDFTLNGYPDLLTVVRNVKENSWSMAALFENIYQHENGTSEGKRLFHFRPVETVAQSKNVRQAAFFDLKEDGRLDFVIDWGDEAKNADNIEFVASGVNLDACFLKIEVYTPTCGTHCVNSSNHENEGTGISLPGACLSYETTDSDGTTKHGAACQKPSNGLHLPFVVFGLGQSPNFVEDLTVGIPCKTNSNRTLTQIIPNARLYIVPFPPEKPQDWIVRMYLTPNRLILLSAAVVLGISGVILLIIVGLQMKERHEDKKERLAEAQKYHFSF